MLSRLSSAYPRSRSLASTDGRLQVAADIVPLTPKNYFLDPPYEYPQDYPIRYSHRQPPHEEPQAQSRRAGDAIWDGGAWNGCRGPRRQGEIPCTSSRCSADRQFRRGSDVGGGLDEGTLEKGHLVRRNTAFSRSSFLTTFCAGMTPRRFPSSRLDAFTQASRCRVLHCISS